MGIQEVLEQSLPEWHDDTQMQARFRAFGKEDENFESHFEFWRRVILLVASAHLDSSILSKEEVRNAFFKRNGLKPLGLDQVLVEMNHRGQLKGLHSLMASYDKSWIRWSVRQLAWGAAATKRVVGSVITGESTSETMLADELVVMDLLKEESDKAEERITSPSGHAILLLEPLLPAIHRNPQEAHLILQELQQRQRVTLFSTVCGGKEVCGVKVATRGERRVPGISEQDRQRLHLKHALQGLEGRATALMNRAAEARELAAGAVKRKDRALGVRCLRRFKLWEKAGLQCEEYAAKIEELLLRIEEAEVTQQVTSAMQAGAQALRSSTVALQHEAESCMEQMDEALASHREVQQALGFDNDEATDAIDRELAELETELALESLSIESAKKETPRKEERPFSTSINGRPSEALHSRTMKEWQEATRKVSKGAEMPDTQGEQSAIVGLQDVGGTKLPAS